MGKDDVTPRSAIKLLLLLGNAILVLGDALGDELREPELSESALGDTFKGDDLIELVEEDVLELGDDLNGENLLELGDEVIFLGDEEGDELPAPGDERCRLGDFRGDAFHSIDTISSSSEL